MRQLKGFILILLAGLLLAGCARAQQESFAYDNESPAAGEAAPSQPEEAFDSFGDEGSVANQAVQDQLIIRTGNLVIVVEDTEATIDAITAQIGSAGGWVVSSNVVQSGQAKSGNMTVRVPVEQFDAMMASIEELAIEVRTSSTNGEDVTEEYVDRRARLENLEATAARVRSFLEDADDVEEALAVNAELSRLEGEIEAARGRIQYLEQSAAFSTITVNITPDALAQPIEIGGWRASGVVRDAIQALITALQGLATIAIWLIVVLLPLALLLLAPLALIFFLIRRRRRATAATAPETEA